MKNTHVKSFARLALIVALLVTMIIFIIIDIRAENTNLIAIVLAVFLFVYTARDLGAFVKTLLANRRRIPDGTLHVRDINNPCDMFEYGEPDARNNCWGDGHGLCKECAYYKPPDEEEYNEN